LNSFNLYIRLQGTQTLKKTTNK